MIPDNITRDHILLAINYIDMNEIPKYRNSKRNNLIYKDRLYPPKYVLTIANKFANKEELSSYNFGGDEAIYFLLCRGFNIVDKGNNIIKEKERSLFSWDVISDKIFIKTLDKSSFLYNGSGIPAGLRKNLGIDNMKNGEKRNLTIVYKDTNYSAFFQKENIRHGRTRLFWDLDFTKQLKNIFVNWNNFVSEFPNKEERPRLRFELIREYYYSLDIIIPRIITEHLESDNEVISATEGSVKYYYTKRYERNSNNRKKAIEIHGTKCCICGFDFLKTYGEIGQNFIEVHHIRPLKSLDEEVLIHPKEDLRPVCANCHRMLHRSNNQVLSIDELKAIILKAKLKN